MANPESDTGLDAGAEAEARRRRLEVLCKCPHGGVVGRVFEPDDREGERQNVENVHILGKLPKATRGGGRSGRTPGSWAPIRCFPRRLPLSP